MFLVIRLFLVISLNLIVASVVATPDSTGDVNTAGDTKEKTQSLHLVTSNKPLALIAQEIVGNYGEVVSLLKAGQSPHDFSLRISDRKRLADADLLIWIGAGMEPYLEKLMSNKTTHQQLRMDSLFQKSQFEHKHDSHAHGSNFHYWLNPQYAERMAKLITQRLIEFRPKQAETFIKNLQQFEQKLQQVDLHIQQTIEAKNFESYGAVHAAYDYFIEYYHLPEPYLISYSTETAPSVKRLLEVRRILPKDSCLLVEPEHAQGWPTQLAAREQFRLVVVDTLAGKPDYLSYSHWLAEFAETFIECAGQ
jgi:zinc transport system substrate-binding protein